MRRRTHWSRFLNQIAQDTAFLRKAGLLYKETPSGFYKLHYSELKNEIVDKLIEAKFEEANEPEHIRAKELWSQHHEELTNA